MPEKKHNNAATRLLNLMRAAINQSPDLTHLQVWSTVFGIQHLSGRQQKQYVHRGIDLMYEQLDRIVEDLKRIHHGEDSYQELVTKVEGNISAEFVNHKWHDARTRLEGALYPLAIISNTLPNEENPLDPDELKVVSTELYDFEKTLAERDISPELRAYVKRQLNIIRRAMWEYRFRGLQAFDEAILNSIKEAYVSKETVELHKDDPAVQEVSTLWNRVWQAVIKAGQIGTALAAGERFYHLVESTLKVSGHH